MLHPRSEIVKLSNSWVGNFLQSHEVAKWDAQFIEWIKDD